MRDAIYMPTTFQVMTKPIGSKCNFNCTYCYYLEKDKLYEGNSSRMDDKTLELFIQQYIQTQTSSVINFVWQGGEPTLLGLDYFEKIIAFQNKYSAGKKIENALQTNGSLLRDEWCVFLKQRDFLVGISIDGPLQIHDYYRKTKKNKPTFAQVMHGIELLHKHDIPFNTLSVVSDFSSKFPLEIYHFLKTIGSGFMQFIPLVERKRDKQLTNDALSLVLPEEKEASLTSWSVKAENYGNFLIWIFEEWVKKDVGKTFVQLFDVTLANWVGQNPGLCVFSEYCGGALVIEHNGDVYSCDHYVYPEYKLGNIHSEMLVECLNKQEQYQFGLNKKKNLPFVCQNCQFLFACRGECPKHRFMVSQDGTRNLNYLCAAYYRFFKHVQPYMDFMANELGHNRPPANVMDFANR